MITDLTTKDVELLQESLQYSHRCVSEARDTPDEVRRLKLAAIEDLRTRLPKVEAPIEG